MKVNEKAEIAIFLQILALNRFFCWRNETRTVKYCYQTKTGARKAVLKAGAVGSPDIIGLTPDGHFIGIEVKSSKEMKRLGLSTEQKDFKTRIEANNGIFWLIDGGFEQLTRKIRDLREGSES